MKRVLSVVITLCLLVVMLPFAAIPVQAAGNPEKALQSIYYVDVAKEELLDESTTGILIKDGKNNLVITAFPSREDKEIYTVFTTEKGEVDFCFFSQTWNQILSMYVADETYGEADGFTPTGVVTEGETVYLVLGWDKDGNKGGYKTTATALKDGIISLKENPGKMTYAIPVINSKNEVCAIYYNEYCLSLKTDESTFYGNGNGKETEPSATEPPATEPPPTEPSDKNQVEGFGMSVELPDLEKLYGEAVNQKKANQSGTIALVVIAVLAVALAAAVIILRRKKQQKIKDMLPEAEEGTTLDDGTVLDDGTELSEKPVVNSNLRLQFRNGKRIAPTRSFTIGRAPDNDIVLPANSSASGHHCEIVVQHGTVCLRDLGSTNGTYINGKRIAAGQLIQLTPGMVVYLGSPNSSEAFQVTHSGM